MITIKKCVARCIKAKKSVKEKHIHLPTHFTSYMPIDKLLQIINTKTPVDTNGHPYIVKPVDFIRCFIKKNIQDGQKHKTFRALTNVLVHLNPTLSVFHIQSFIWWVNQNCTCSQPMDRRRMDSVVQYAFDESKECGLWETSKKWLKVKWIHFSKDCGFSPQQKKKIAARLTGDRKMNESIEIIKQAISELEELGDEVYQRSVTKHLNGIRSESTVKKYWKIIYPKVVTTEPEAIIEHIQLEEPVKVDTDPINHFQAPSIMNCNEFKRQHDTIFIRPIEMHIRYNQYLRDAIRRDIQNPQTGSP